MNPYRSIQEKLLLEQDLPYTPKWSAAADFLLLITEHALQTTPDTLLECSSGLTTLTLARCCQLNGHGHVYSLENSLEHAENTRGHLELLALADYATVIHAPLEEKIIDNNRYAWYTTEALPDLSAEMLVIDGPPGFIQKHSRYPALPMLYEYLAEVCTIYLDDAARKDEKEIVALWQANFPALNHEYADTERGCAILKVSK